MEIEKLRKLVALLDEYMETEGIEDRFLEEGTQNRVVHNFVHTQGHLIKTLRIREGKEV